MLYKYLNKQGHSNEWIVSKFLEPKLMVSRTTFYEYLELPAKAWLKKQMAGETYIKDTEQLFEAYVFIYSQMDTKKRIK